jgi:hypothetical protein
MSLSLAISSTSPVQFGHETDKISFDDVVGLTIDEVNFSERVIDLIYDIYFVYSANPYLNSP